MPESEKFKPAFDRFEKWAKSNELKLKPMTYPEIKVLFGFFQGQKGPVTNKQDSVLKYVCADRKIAYIAIVQRPTYRQYKNVGTGRFIKKSEAEKALEK